MLKTQLGMSLTTGVSSDEETRLKHLLTHKQAWLATEYEWPFLKTRSGVALTVGTRYYTLPTDLDFDHDTKSEVQWNGIWQDVDYGINGEEFNVWDSDNGEQQAPVHRWQHYGQLQMEVWPIPSVAQTFRFSGPAKMGSFVNGDTCQIDDQLLVLFTAADELERREQPRLAQTKLAQAQQRLARLLAQYPRRDPVWNLNPDFERGKRRLISAVGGGINSLTGSYNIPNGVSSGTVTYASQSPVPTGGVLTVQSPVGGFNLFATIVSAPGATSFNFSLSGVTDSANYVLHYRLHF